MTSTLTLTLTDDETGRATSRSVRLADNRLASANIEAWATRLGLKLTHPLADTTGGGEAR